MGVPKERVSERWDGSPGSHAFAACTVILSRNQVLDYLFLVLYGGVFIVIGVMFRECRRNIRCTVWNRCLAEHFLELP